MGNLFNYFIFSSVRLWHVENGMPLRHQILHVYRAEELQPTFIWNCGPSSVSFMFLYNQKPVFPLEYTVLILYYHSFYSYDHELVFGVSLKNMNKAERLTFGESLMTHAMTFTAVSEKV